MNFIFQRSRRHTVGILVGAFPCGIITLFDELYGSESLTQVYAIVIEYLAELPKSSREKLIEILYDDACHLKKFSENEDRAEINEITRFMASLGKHIDKGSLQNQNIVKFHKQNLIVKLDNFQLSRAWHSSDPAFHEQHSGHVVHNIILSS